MGDVIHVLIVDDSSVAQKVVSVHMANCGCTVDSASDGITALKKTMNTRYDLILMDISLGEGPDGFEVARLIKQQSSLNKTTPIIAITAHSDAAYQDKAVEYGMAGYFNKPFTPKDAVTAINMLQKLSA